MANCPPRGKAMEGGFLGAKNWPSWIQWYRSKNFFGLGGEPIGENDVQMSWLACPGASIAASSSPRIENLK